MDLDNQLLLWPAVYRRRHVQLTVIVALLYCIGIMQTTKTQIILINGRSNKVHKKCA